MIILGAGAAKAYVYGLRFTQEGHPASGLLRYVGKSVNPRHRFRRHMNPRDNYGAVQRAVLKHGAECFGLEILAECRGQTIAGAERLSLDVEVAMIARHGTSSQPYGLNLTVGGEGTSLVGEARQRASAKSREVLAAVKQRPEVRAKYKELARKRSQRPGGLTALHSKESQRRRAETLRRRHAEDPEFHQKMVEHMRSVSQLDVTREAKKNRIQPPETASRKAKRESHYWKFRTNEARSRASSVAAAQHQDPAFSEKYRAGLARRYADPVLRAEHAEKSRERHRKDPAFGRAAKIGIALHWADRHLRDGKLDAASKQFQTLAFVLREAWADPVTPQVREAYGRLEAIGITSLFDPRAEDQSAIRLAVQDFMDRHGAAA